MAVQKSMDKKRRNKEVLVALEDLALAVGKGFDDTRVEFEKVHREIADVRQDIHRLEVIVLQDHERRIEALEAKLSAR